MKETVDYRVQTCTSLHTASVAHAGCVGSDNSKNGVLVSWFSLKGKSFHALSLWWKNTLENGQEMFCCGLKYARIEEKSHVSSFQILRYFSQTSMRLKGRQRRHSFIGVSDVLSFLSVIRVSEEILTMSQIELTFVKSEIKESKLLKKANLFIRSHLTQTLCISYKDG